jgi:putative Mg2+ transporter-C (MgtC) family protein
MNIGEAIGLVGTQTPYHVLAIRLLVSAVLGGAIGFERQMHPSDAGLRTYIMVSVAAALYSELTFELFDRIGGPSSRADPGRAIQAVTAGIAFLGAGAIFRYGRDVKGLTTSAGLWLAGAVGIATALGYYPLALSATVLALIVLHGLEGLKRRVEARSEERNEKEQASGDGAQR